MIAAYLANIKVFVTGGIGGVHRGASETFDISADLTELGRTPVAVVCAGVKSILDIGKTLEYLVSFFLTNREAHIIKETQGVPVVTVGGADREFPAFFTRSSGFQSPMALQSPQDCANMMGKFL